MLMCYSSDCLQMKMSQLRLVMWLLVTFISMYILFTYYISQLSQFPQTSITDNANRNDIITIPPPCIPKTSILLAKTHKTAGSTLGTIIARYGYERYLTFALPAESFIIGYDFFTDSMLLQKPPPNGFDILMNHVRFDKSSMTMVMNPNAKYVTILREPVARWYSTVEYYALWKLAYSWEEYNERMGSFNINEFLLKIFGCNSFNCRLGQDGQLFDLGFLGRTSPEEDTDLVEAKVEELQNEFNLVLIAEYFDESLLLLKRLMCWDFRNIVYLKKKQSRMERKKPFHEASSIRHWNKGDVLLYKHFNETLWEKIEKYGPSFDDDLRYFRNLNARVTEMCRAGPSSPYARAIAGEVFDDSLKLEYTCNNLRRDIRPYTELLVKSVLRKGKP